MSGRATGDIVADLRSHNPSSGPQSVRDANKGDLRNQAADRLAELDAKVANANKMVLLIEAYIYDPHRITQGGLVAQIQRYMTDQDVEYEP